MLPGQSSDPGSAHYNCIQINYKIMANTGPDGINRCGFLRGKKCEQDRYNQEMAAKAAAAASVIKEEKATVETNYTLIILAFASIVIIGIVVYMKLNLKNR